jgi:hypothetical protein
MRVGDKLVETHWSGRKSSFTVGFNSIRFIGSNGLTFVSARKASESAFCSGVNLCCAEAETALKVNMASVKKWT